MVVVPIGSGGLISGVSVALKTANPAIRVVGVESDAAPAMKRSVEEGASSLDQRRHVQADGLRVKRVGERTFSSSALAGDRASPSRCPRHRSAAASSRS